MNPFVAVILFSVVGTLLMFLQVFLFQLTYHHRIATELNEKNPAIAWVLAGLLISVGLVIHSAMAHNASLLSSVAYSILGMVLNILGYHVTEWISPRWNLAKSIHEHDVTGGVVVFGVFVAIGLVVSGAIS